MRFALALAFAFIAGCAAGPHTAHVPDPVSTPAPVPVRFVAWGDAGHGNDQQRATAAAAGALCARDGCDFALGLGDNVYPSGVSSVGDWQFEAKFEAPYANLTMPFYMVLGGP